MLEGWQKELLRVNRCELVELMVPEDLINKLYSRGIVSSRQRTDIPHNKSIFAQNETILNLIERRTPNEYYVFCDCLKETNQGSIVDNYLVGFQNRGDTNSTDAPCDHLGSNQSACSLPQTTSFAGNDSSKCVQPASILSKNGRTSPFTDSMSTISQRLEQERPGSTTDSASIEESFEQFECDAEHDVVVIKTTESFYNQTKSLAFSMNKAKKGKAVIFNITAIFGRRPRKGTEVDRDKLFNLLLELDFDVLVYNDADGLTAEGLTTKMETFAGMFTPEDQSAVVCLLSHGAEGSIFGTDGQEVSIDHLLDKLDNERCPALRGKPKLAFIQACRGRKADTGALYESDADSIPNLSRHPTREDFLIAYPTQAGYMSWRNTKKGSYFIGALVRIFMQYACKEDICTLLHMVNRVVARTVAHVDGVECMEMSVYESSLATKPKFYFYPGIISQS